MISTKPHVLLFVLLLPFAMASMFSAAHAESSRLGEIGSSLRSADSKPKKERSGSGSSSNYDWDDDDDSVWGNFWGELLGELFVAPFRAMRASSTPSYVRHPYDGFGYVSNDFGVPEEPWPWNGNVGLLAGYADEELDWWGFDADFVSPIGLGLRTEILQYREVVDSDDDEEISARLQDIQLLWRQFESPHVMWDIHLGYIGFVDDVSHEGGINIGTELTIMPLKPMIIHASTAAGNINGLAVYRHELGLGAVYQGVELHGGYRWTSIDGIDLDGFHAGLRWWF